MSSRPKNPKRPSGKPASKRAKQQATQELEIFDSFTVLPIAAEFNSRAIIYLTLAGTLISTISLGSLPPFYMILVVFCMIYPLAGRFFSLPFRRRFPKHVGYGLVVFDAFFTGAMISTMGAPIEPSILIFIMANASFIVMGQTTAYLLCLIFFATGCCPRLPPAPQLSAG